MLVFDIIAIPWVVGSKLETKGHWWDKFVLYEYFLSCAAVIIPHTDILHSHRDESLFSGCTARVMLTLLTVRGLLRSYLVLMSPT